MFQHYSTKKRATHPFGSTGGSASPAIAAPVQSPSQYLFDSRPKQSQNGIPLSIKGTPSLAANLEKPSGETLFDRLQTMEVLRRVPTQKRSFARVDSILNAASEICIEHDIESVTTASVSEKLQMPIGTVYQFFENRQAIVRGLAVRTNFMADQVIRLELSRFNPGTEWFSAAAQAIDRSIDVFLQHDDLVRIIRSMYHTSIYQEINRRTIAGLVDRLLMYFSNIGIKPTPQRRDTAYFALRVASFCQHMTILEVDEHRREFLREQYKILGANYLLQALVANNR